jgi:hypothetical protein
MPAPAVVAAVTTVGYLGSFTGPPAVGALAELVGIAASLMLMAVACAAIAVLGPRAVGSGTPFPTRHRDSPV